MIDTVAKLSVNPQNLPLSRTIVSEPRHNDVAQIRLRESYRSYDSETQIDTVNIDLLELRAPNQFTSPRDAQPFWADCGITIHGEVNRHDPSAVPVVEIKYSSGGASSLQQIRRYAERYDYAFLLYREVCDRLIGMLENAAYTPLDRFEVVED